MTTQPHSLPRSLRPAIVLVAVAALVALMVAGPTTVVAGKASSSRATPPPTLGQAGLYSDIRSKTVAPENLPYAPQYPLYTDGAVKSRWIYLPPGQQIDASEPDQWVFPVGTRIFKEFAFAGVAKYLCLP